MSTSERPYHHGDLAAALLEAAEALLQAEGIAAVSLREVARRAGVSAMAPYRHFASKEALLAAVAARGFAAFGAKLAAADARDDPVEALVAQGAAYVAFACDDPALFRLMFASPSELTGPALHAAGEMAYGVLTRRVASLAAPDGRAEAVLAAWSMVHGLSALLIDGRLGRVDEPAALAARVTRLLLTGIRSQCSTSSPPPTEWSSTSATPPPTT